MRPKRVQCRLNTRQISQPCYLRPKRPILHDELVHNSAVLYLSGLGVAFPHGGVQRGTLLKNCDFLIGECSW